MFYEENSRRVYMDSDAREFPGHAAVTTPIIDEHTFDQDYFTTVSNYAGKYDRYNPPHKIAGYLAEIRRLAPSGTLLDAGCAFGKFLREASRHYTCEGLDISEYALTVARQKVPDLPLHHAAIEAFDPGRTYDVVTCFDVLEHIPSLDLALGSLRRMLSPRSVLAVAVPVYDTPPGWGFRLIDKDPTHLHKFDRGDWLRRFRAAGLDPVVAKGCFRAPLPGYFVHQIGRVLWWFSSAIFVICRPA
jgi:2-polyprenyl-3-methyl-5-hydroxy-6-metoxy-1,4-benzoquinol methylase